jgi:hypothetical protein
MLSIACSVFVFAGCDESESTSTRKDAPPSAPAAPEPPKNDAAKAELTYDTRIETSGEKSTVYWTAKVPTGGWTMTTDQKPSVEERNTLWWVRVWVTIEAPNPNDMVTQAFETLEGKFEADRKINRVEFSVRRKVKGQESQWAPLYSVVKTGPDWVTDDDKVK